MQKRGMTAGPDDLDLLTAAFQTAWREVQARSATPVHREHAHREWLAKLVLGLRREGYVSDLAAVAADQFIATTASTAEK